MESERECCPCCGYYTLPLREHPQMPTFDICYLCHWQDDGQSDIDADKVYGGPNGSYSLYEARVNFKKYLVKYSPDNDTRVVPTDLPEEISIKKLLINLFNESKLINDKCKKEKIWLEISGAEDRLHTIVAQKIKPFVKKEHV